jgi:hypothetical protein
MTIHDRTPEIIGSVISCMRFPGNRPDVVLVCYDRAPQESVDAMRLECKNIGVELREIFLKDNAVGPRCPSLAWNKALSLSNESHIMCISSDVVMSPHSLDMAYHLSEAAPDHVIIGRAEHSGPSYKWHHTFTPANKEPNEEIVDRSMTSATFAEPLGFIWLLPMKTVRRIGGYNEAYMNGLCYEDADFVLRLWNAGADFLFCDDVFAIHMEHRREHLKNRDGKISTNEKLFVDEYGDIKYLAQKKFKPNVALYDVGMSIWSHERDMEIINRTHLQQRLYGQGQPWQAIPVEIKEAKEE